MKYWNPKSWTWRLGVAIIILAVILAVSENFGILVSWAGLIDSLSGGTKSAVMAAYGLSLITVRAALPK